MQVVYLECTLSKSVDMIEMIHVQYIHHNTCTWPASTKLHRVRPHNKQYLYVYTIVKLVFCINTLK